MSRELRILCIRGGLPLAFSALPVLLCYHGILSEKLSNSIDVHYHAVEITLRRARSVPELPKLFSESGCGVEIYALREGAITAAAHFPPFGEFRL